jgi:hypothetical protein
MGFKYESIEELDKDMGIQTEAAGICEEVASAYDDLRAKYQKLHDMQAKVKNPELKDRIDQAYDMGPDSGEYGEGHILEIDLDDYLPEETE